LEGHGCRISCRPNCRALAKKDSNRVYAEIETGDGVPQPNSPGQLGNSGVPTTAARNWEMVNSDRQLPGAALLHAHGNRAGKRNEVFFFSASFSRTLDGGHTLTKMPSIPAATITDVDDPTNGDRMAVVNDGGVEIFLSTRFLEPRNLPIDRCITSLDDQISTSFMATGQTARLGAARAIAAVRRLSTVTHPRGAWHPVAGGESGFAGPSGGQQHHLVTAQDQAASAAR